MAEVYRPHLVEKGDSEHAAPFIAAKSLEDIQTLQPAIDTLPIVIYDSPTLQLLKPGELANRMRTRKVRNTLIYYAPTRAIPPEEKEQFFDSGGDILVDINDIGPHEQDPLKEVILQKHIQRLTKETIAIQHPRDVYEFGISLDAKGQEIFVNNHRLKITAPQFHILETFFALRAQTGSEYVSTHALCTELEYLRKSDSLLSTQIKLINQQLKPYGVSLSAEVGRNSRGYKLTGPQNT